MSYKEYGVTYNILRVLQGAYPMRVSDKSVSHECHCKIASQESEECQCLTPSVFQECHQECHTTSDLPKCVTRVLYHVHLTRVYHKSAFLPSVSLRVYLTNGSHQECLSEQMCWHSCAAYGTQRSIFATADKVMLMVRQFGILFQCDPNCEATGHWSAFTCRSIHLGCIRPEERPSSFLTGFLVKSSGSSLHIVSR